MKNFYLDHNIYIAALKNTSIRETVLSLKNREVRFFYSPAHVEEIYKALTEKREKYQETANLLLHMLSEFTDNWELLPSNYDGIVERKENPYVCFKRVSGVDTTERVRVDSKMKYRSDSKNYKAMIDEDKHNQNLSNIPIDKIWKHPIFSSTISEVNANIQNIIIKHNNSYDTYFCAMLGADKRLPEDIQIKEGCYSNLKSNHAQLEFIMEILFRILTRNGYNSDKSEETTVSGTHDVTHAIYASNTDLLFTTDGRFAKRCAAVYYYLGIPTKVVHCKEEKIVFELLNNSSSSQQNA